MIAVAQTHQRGSYQAESGTTPEWAGLIQWGGLFMLAAGAIVLLFIAAVLISKLTLPMPAADMLENPGLPAVLFVLATAVSSAAEHGWGEGRRDLPTEVTVVVALAVGIG